jgi:hypothetical protein
MDAAYSQVFCPASIAELFAVWKRCPDARLFAGGTTFLVEENGRALYPPPNIISLGKIEELKKISRTERYLEIGAMVHSAQVLDLRKIVPGILSKTLEANSTPQLRNIETLGGAICDPKQNHIAASMVALDARYEIRDAAQTSTWVSAIRFAASRLPARCQTPVSDTTVSPPVAPQVSQKPPVPPLVSDTAFPVPRHSLLVRVRLPLEQWDYSLNRKFDAALPDDPSECYCVFLARIQKNILSDIRMVFAIRQDSGETIILRDKNSELTLSGKKLPLDKKVVTQYTGLWSDAGKTASGESALKATPFMRARILSFIEDAILQLCD